MTHDDESDRHELDDRSGDDYADSVRTIVELLGQRQVSGSALLPFPRPPLLPNIDGPTAREERRSARPAPTAGGSVAPVALGRTVPPEPLDLERTRREVRRRTAIASCAMAVPVVAMLVIGAVGSRDSRHGPGAAQAHGGLARNAIELTEASSQLEKQAPAADAQLDQGNAGRDDEPSVRFEVPETMIVGVLKTSRERTALAGASGAPAPSPSESLAAMPAPRAEGSAASDAVKVGRALGRLSPVDSPLGAATLAAPGATELVVTSTARPAIPGTESQVPPTRLEPDHVAARGRLDTGR